MNRNMRAIFSDNGTLSDYTVQLNNFRSQTVTMPFTASQDYLYIGSRLPFNHLHFDVSTANNVASAVSVDLWWASAWHAALDVIDATATSGVSLAQSGVISWVPDSNKGWDAWGRNDTENGLQTLNIFDLYWCRIKWSVTLLNTTALKFIGQKFATDDQLYTYYPNLNQADLKAAYGNSPSKVDWNEQHYAAAREIASELERTRVLLTRDQILDVNLFQEAGIHKCAELIYQGMGKDYRQQMQDARAAFKNALALKSLRLDKDADATLDWFEVSNTVGTLFR